MYTKKQIRELIKEEKKTAKDYFKHGLKSMGRDEAKHAFFFSKELKRLSK